eukprot:m.105504 g.105504  ORF g.105504 m.105504 type:complete len:948 (-) comp12656_c0_seq1:1114-3957(-)
MTVEIVTPTANENNVCSYDKKAGILCPHVVLDVDPNTGAVAARQSSGDGSATSTSWDDRLSLSERNTVFLPIHKQSSAYTHLERETEKIEATIKESKLALPQYTKAKLRSSSKSKSKSYTLVLRNVLENGEKITYALFTYAYSGPRGECEGGLELPGGKGEVNEKANALAHRRVLELTGLDFPSLQTATSVTSVVVDKVKTSYFCIQENLMDKSEDEIQWTGPGIHLGESAGVCWVRLSQQFLESLPTKMHLTSFNNDEVGPGPENHWVAHLFTAPLCFMLGKFAGLEQQVKPVIGSTVFIQRAFDELDKRELIPEKVFEDDAPVLSDSLDTFVVVTGFPATEAKKLPKLKKFVEQKIDKSFVSFDFSTTESGDGDGTAFVEYKTVAEANEGSKKFHSSKVGKAVLSAALLSEFDSILETEDEYVEPELKLDLDEEHLHSWTLQEHAYDQFVVTEGNTTTVCENSVTKSNTLFTKDKWSNAPAMWSPSGGYLITFRTQGVVLWGKTGLKCLQRFLHQKVKMVDFSPNERYLVTYSEECRKRFVIWNIETGEECRSFDVPLTAWPLFQWSACGNYCARKVNNGIIIYDAKTNFKKLDMKNVAIPRIKSFSWSPVKPFFCYWTPEQDAIPLRVAIMGVPRKEDLVARNVVRAEKCTMFWQKSGEYLCVMINRVAKKTITDLEIFHVGSKNLPCDHLEIKEKIVSFEWEPVGNKFCILVSNEKETLFKNVFYQVLKGKIVELGSITPRYKTTISWSPAGKYCVLAELDTDEAPLHFMDVSGSKVARMVEQTHNKVSHLDWDPTGRFIVTSVRYSNSKDDNGYRVWSFTGRLLREEQCQRLWHFQWRPRPASIITPQHIKQINKNYKMFAEKFDAERKVAERTEDQERLQRDQEVYDAWNKVVESEARRMDRYNDFFNNLPGWNASSEMASSTETFYELLSRKEEEIKEEK